MFADFYPKEEFFWINYRNKNSANISGLIKLEKLIEKIGPPKYPWKIDEALAAQGKKIFNRPTEQGGCYKCHGIKPGVTRFYNNKTWATPLIDVGTDTREYSILDWEVDTGVLNGRRIPGVVKKLKPRDKAFNVLTLSVVGSMIEYSPEIIKGLLLNQKSASEKPKRRAMKQIMNARANLVLPKQFRDLKGAFNDPLKQGASTYVYELRVLQGIWAAAPYLHNGSVPTLADLLEPVEKRPKQFKIGPNYDPQKIGLAKEQTKFGNQTLHTTPNDRNSGDSNMGHEYGVNLTPEEQKALLEYLKLL